MHLEGSCHCGAGGLAADRAIAEVEGIGVRGLDAEADGAGGFAINIGAETASLAIEGAEHIRSYRAVLHDEGGAVSPGERKFCGLCGSPLWVWDPRWPELVHPHAGAIDTPLPVPPERTHLMLGSKANWVEPCVGPTDKTIERYPEESLAAWHQRLGVGG